MAEVKAEGRTVQTAVPPSNHDRRKQGALLHHEETYTTDASEVVGTKVIFMENVPPKGARIKLKNSRVHFGAMGASATANFGYRYGDSGTFVAAFGTLVDVSAAGSSDLAEAGATGDASFEVTADNFQFVVETSGATYAADKPLTADLIFAV